MNSEELQNRLVRFSVDILHLSNKIAINYAGNHLGKQLIRSGTSVSLNYAEARGAESIRDFIHKIKVVLKELRETQICIQIINESELFKRSDCTRIYNESSELVAIFTSTAKSAEAKLRSKK